MICPYNGFKEMDCTKCAAMYESISVIPFLDGKLEERKESECKLIMHGAPVPSDVHVSYEGIHFHPNKLEQWRQLAEDDLK